MRLSLCMIVRDNCSTIEECLNSIRPYVDEMIVVDTGSTDGTDRIAASLGATVGYFPWRDDFAAARNASIERATGDWIFWMDSDDVIDETNGRGLREIICRPADPNMLGFVMQVHCPGTNGALGGDVTIVDHIKIFRNILPLRFEGRIHEQILPAIRRQGGDVEFTPLYVTHKYGAATPERKARKHARDLRILELELQERGEHPFVLFNLGMTLCDMAKHEQASVFLQRSIDASQGDGSHLCKAYSLLASCRIALQQFQEAESVCALATASFPDDPELLFRSAIVAHAMGDSTRAIELYRRLLDVGSSGSRASNVFLSRDIGIVGHKARHNLAAVLADTGQLSQAEWELRQAIREAPSFRPALIGLGRMLVQQKKNVTAGLLARELRGQPETAYAAHLIEASICESRGDMRAAIDLLHRADDLEQSGDEHLEELGRMLFSDARWHEAEPIFAKLAAIRPGDAGTAHNYGAVLLALGKHDLAAAALRQSLTLRPNHRKTLEMLTIATQETDAR